MDKNKIANKYNLIVTKIVHKQTWDELVKAYLVLKLKTIDQGG